MKKIIFLFVAFFCLFLHSNVVAKIENQSPRIISVKLLQDKKSSKVIIKFSDVFKTKPIAMTTLETVTFDLDYVYKKDAKHKREKKNESNHQFKISSKGFLKKISWFTNGKKTYFEIKREYYTPVKFINQNESKTLIVEFPRTYFDIESTELKPGITKHLIRTVKRNSPVTAHALEIDLKRKNVSIKVGLPDSKKIKAKDTLLNIVKNSMAFAGINANYFDVKVGNPLGTLITDGTWLVGPVYDRVAVGFSKDNMVFIDQIMLSGNATIYRGFIKKPFAMFVIDGLNVPFHLYKKIGLYTVNWDEKLEVPKQKVAAIVKHNCINKIVDGSIEISDDGYVIVSNKDYILNYFKKKDCLKIEWQTSPNWSEVHEAISGGPYLIMDGKVYVDELAQNFKFARKDTYAPRSAVGINAEGNLFLIAVDGRRSGYSVGVTLKELAELLKKLNLKEAINLDGGGSTTLVASGEIINRLSERHERKISNALLIFYKD